MKGRKFVYQIVTDEAEIESILVSERSDASPLCSDPRNSKGEGARAAPGPPAVARRRPPAAALCGDSRAECEPALISRSAGNSEKRYLINFRQVGVIVLQSRPRPDARAAPPFESGVGGARLIFTPNGVAGKGAVTRRRFPINIALTGGDGAAPSPGARGREVQAHRALKGLANYRDVR
ncbi:hypothetical protein EVAR_52165_1 [Eumeta japonica]|uniref:Uncharacterized protein n=1 Tax=Eumeta variegata TaxID=151549 RepID=A0A4C1Y9S5_EUMVA|nr:hypothetical protein EVAR_52165_1 [Eumeta japonica]